MVHKIRLLPAIGKVLESIKYGIYFNFLLEYERIPASFERSQWKKTKQIEWAFKRRRYTCLFVMWPFWDIILGIVSGRNCSKAKGCWGLISSWVIEAMTEGAGLDFHSPSSGARDQDSSGRPSRLPAGVCYLLPFSLLHHPPPVAQGRSGHPLAQCAADQLQEKSEQLWVQACDRDACW